MIDRWIEEFRAVPWTPRGRRVGHILAGILGVLALTSPGWIEGVVFGLIGR